MISARAAALISAFVLLAMTACRAAPLARVAQGLLSGRRIGSVDVFLGVPYAAAPIGANRWRAPQLAPSWHGIRPATRFAPACMQALTPHGIGPWTGVCQ